MKTKIIFTRNSSMISRIIRWVTKSEVSHVSVLVDTSLGEDMLLDVTFNGYKLIPLEAFIEQGNEIVKCFDIKHDLSLGIKLIARWLNKPYDYKGLLAFLNIFNRIFKTKLNNPMDNPKEVICSEVVTILLQKSKFPGTDYLIPKKTSPKDLYDLLMKVSEMDTNQYYLMVE